MWWKSDFTWCWTCCQSHQKHPVLLVFELLMKSVIFISSFLVPLFAEPSRRKPSPWTLRSTAAWAAVRICPRSALPSTPSDRFDPSSSRPSSPPRLPSTPKRHLEVRNAFLKTNRAWNLFCCDFAAACDDTKGTTCAQNESSHLNKDSEKHALSAAPLQRATAPCSNGRRWGGAAHWRSYWRMHYRVRKTLNWERDASKQGQP